MKRLIKPTIVVLAVLFALQFVFAGELLAAELLFTLGFAIVLVLGVLAYLYKELGGSSVPFA